MGSGLRLGLGSGIGGGVRGLPCGRIRRGTRLAGRGRGRRRGGLAEAIDGGAAREIRGPSEIDGGHLAFSLVVVKIRVEEMIAL